MIEIRSSWIVEDGFARPLGTEPRRSSEIRKYHCSACGERGHAATTCGRERRR